MPTREGQRQRKKHNREHSHQEPQLKDKKQRRNESDFDQHDEMDEAVHDDDYDEEEEDMDLWPLDNVRSSYRTTRSGHISGRNTGPATHQVLPGNAEAQLPAVTEMSNVSATQRSLDDRQLPAEIFIIFSGVKPTTEVVRVLKSIQDEEERYRKSRGKLGRGMLTRSLSHTLSRDEIIEHFKKVSVPNCDEVDRKQIIQYIRKPILKELSYGVLLYNSKGEILVVENSSGNWSAPMGHRKINDNHQLESIKETASRKFNEKIRVENHSTKETYSVYDIDKEYHMDSSKYAEYNRGPVSIGSNARCVGLFMIEIDQSKLEFRLRDSSESQDLQWVKLDTIINHIPKTNSDIYYTLRPFVEKLKNMLMFHGNHLDD